jgi:hypothetical protein
LRVANKVSTQDGTMSTAARFVIESGKPGVQLLS